MDKEWEESLETHSLQASAGIKTHLPHTVTNQALGTERSGLVSQQIDEDRNAIHFATVQLFVAIYLQKFAVGPLSFQISVPILVMLSHIGFMLITGRMQFAPLRFACYLMFAASCLISQAISGTSFSIPSIVELLLIYGCFTVTMSVSEAAYQVVMKHFVSLMIVPAIIVFTQYFYQKITGLSDPISMTRIFPKSVLLQGYFYEAHYPWNSPFQRPNGFFFLEPSVVSLFTASAAIIEITFFKRIPYILMMIAATVLSLGGTGGVMLLIASPFLLARQRLPVILLVVTVGLVALSAAIALNVPLPLLSRVDELHHTTSSFGGRVLVPAAHIVALLFDPSHIFTGTGAGSTTADLGLAWAMLKLLNEYGLLSTLLYGTLYLMVVARSYNVPLAIAISVIFHFTGGYLLDAMVVQLIAIIFCIVVPSGSTDRKPTPTGYGRRSSREVSVDYHSERPILGLEARAAVAKLPASRH